MADLVAKSRRILDAVDAYHNQASADTRLALRKVIMAELETAGVMAVRELENIVKAKRFDREVFDDDAGFADWVQSRARHVLKACEDGSGVPVTVDAAKVADALEQSAKANGSHHQQADWQRHAQRRGAELIRAAYGVKTVVGSPAE